MVVINKNLARLLFLQLLLIYQYIMGLRSPKWLPFWPPFLTASKQFIEKQQQNQINYAVILSFNTKPSLSALGQPLWKRLPASDQADPWIPRHRRGKWLRHGGDVCGLLCWWWTVHSVFSYRRNPTGREFFVSAGTLQRLSCQTSKTNLGGSVLVRFLQFSQSKQDRGALMRARKPKNRAGELLDMGGCLYIF